MERLIYLFCKLYKTLSHVTYAIDIPNACYIYIYIYIYMPYAFCYNVLYVFQQLMTLNIALGINSICVVIGSWSRLHISKQSCSFLKWCVQRTHRLSWKIEHACITLSVGYFSYLLWFMWCSYYVKWQYCWGNRYQRLILLSGVHMLKNIKWQMFKDNLLFCENNVLAILVNYSAF